MKKPINTSVLALFILFCTQLWSQKWVNSLSDPNPNFYDIQKAFNNQFNTRSPGLNIDDDYMKFKRWEYFMQTRVDKNGYFHPDATWKIFDSINNPSLNRTSATTSAASASWTSMGPQTKGSTTNGFGAGRLNCIQFDPVNPNIIWVGSAAGGLWRSTNSGNTWTDMNPNMPNLSISDIAIHPTGTNTMYIATGDGFGYVSNFAFWGGSYSNGVLKSTNGGTTWSPTGLTYTLNQGQIINRLVIKPNNPNILFACGTDGLYRTLNAGVTWTKLRSGRFYDIEFNPLNPNTMYVTKDSTFKSVDGGNTWQFLSGLPVINSFWYTRQTIETTAADTNYVYWMDYNRNTYKSTNGGSTWTFMTSWPTLTAFGYYMHVLSVCPTNKDLVYAAGYDLARSDDGCVTTTLVVTNSTPILDVHPDIHAVEFVPSTTNIYCANDGGISRSNDGGINWINYTSGLQLTQFYKLCVCASNPSFVFAGSQDDGTMGYNNGNWSFSYLYGDGMECMVDYLNSNNVYASWQNGYMAKSTDAGVTFTPIPNGGPGFWVTPMAMHPTNPLILYYANADLKKSIDGGLTWNTVASSVAAGWNVNNIVVSKQNPNYIYVSSLKSIHVTTDGGTTWTNISAGLPIPTNNLTHLAVSTNTPGTAWVTIGNFDSGNKVFKSTNAGATWTNISGNLPNIPANCVVYNENSTLDAIYIGTDMGVWYLDTTMANNWTTFNTNLPNVIVDELEINYLSQKIYAATYGRGIWESPLDVQPLPTETKKTQKIKSTSSIYPNPTNGLFFVDVNSTAGESPVKITVFDLNGEKVYFTSDGSISSKQYAIDLRKMPSGIYFVKIETEFETTTRKIVVTR